MGIMKNWTIGKRLTLGFAGVVLITVCVSIYAFTRLEAIQSQATALANDSLPGAVLMGQIAALSEREVALVLQHIKANDAQEVQKLDEALRRSKRGGPCCLLVHRIIDFQSDYLVRGMRPLIDGRSATPFC